MELDDFKFLLGTAFISIAALSAIVGYAVRALEDEYKTRQRIRLYQAKK